jgi:lipoprotein-releasing system permease protein
MYLCLCSGENKEIVLCSWDTHERHLPIFLWQGALIAGAGSLLGCLLGAIMTWGISHIPIRIRGLLYADYFLVTWEWRHYVFATLLAILAVFIASYVPARRAAELPPVVTIRGAR